MLACEIIDDYELEVEDYLDGISDENPFGGDLDESLHEWEEFELAHWTVRSVA